jgi:hypothetical protein
LNRFWRIVAFRSAKDSFPRKGAPFAERKAKMPVFVNFADAAMKPAGFFLRYGMKSGGFLPKMRILGETSQIVSGKTLLKMFLTPPNGMQS